MSDAEYTAMWLIVFAVIGLVVIAIGCVRIGILESRAKKAEREWAEDTRLAEEYDRERDYHLPPSERRWSA